MTDHEQEPDGAEPDPAPETAPEDPQEPDGQPEQTEGDGTATAEPDGAEPERDDDDPEGPDEDEPEDEEPERRPARRGYTTQPVDLGGNPLGPARSFGGTPVPTEEPTPGPEPDPDPDGYPADGTVADVLAWVGDEGLTDEVRSDRAKAAVVAEHDRDKPRKTLLQELQERTG